MATVGVRTVAELVYGFVNADGGWDEEEEDGVEGEERGRMAVVVVVVEKVGRFGWCPGWLRPLLRRRRW